MKYTKYFKVVTNLLIFLTCVISIIFSFSVEAWGFGIFSFLTCIAAGICFVKDTIQLLSPPPTEEEMFKEKAEWENFLAERDEINKPNWKLD